MSPGSGMCVQEWNQSDMPDPPVRPGPPIPPAPAGALAAENVQRSAPRGPYGLPFPRPVTKPATPDSPATPRRSTAHSPEQTPALRTRRAPTGNERGSHIVPIVLVILLVAGALWADRGRHNPVAGYGPIPQPGTVLVVPDSALDVGDLAPNFRLLDTAGEIVELSSLRGRPVLLHFWTTWCLECAVDLPVMQDLSGQYGEDLQVIGVDVGEPAGRVDAAAERHGARYPMLLDRDELVARAYGVSTYPATFVIDAEGVIVSTQAGAVTIEEVRNQVEPLGIGQ